MAKRKVLIETRESYRNEEAMTPAHKVACARARALITEAVMALEAAGMRASASFNASERTFDVSVSRSGRTP